MRSKPETSLAQEFSFSKSNGRLLKCFMGRGNMQSNLHFERIPLVTP